MKLLWKIKLDNQPRQMHSLFPPLIAGNVATAVGRRRKSPSSRASPTTSSASTSTAASCCGGNISTARSRSRRAAAAAATLCPGGLTATPVLDQPTPGKYIAYAVSWDGRLRKLDVATGEEIEPPALFLPPNGKPYALNLVNGVIYTTTAQGCGGNPNNFYSYDLATKKVGNWTPGSGGLWPRTGPSVGKDGTVYAGSGDGDYVPAQQIYGQALIGVKQNPQTKALELKDWYAPIDAYWMRKRDLDFNTSSPIFDYKGKEYIVSSSKECRIWLLDTAAMGGEDHRTPVDRTPLICNEEVNFTMGVWGALATWQDAKGTRWVLTPFWGPKHSRFEAPIEHGQIVYGAVAAFKVVDDPKTGKPTLIPAWISRDMYMADPPVIANGVVYAYGSGESTTQRWPEPGHIGGSAGTHPGIDARGAVRARCRDRRRALVERRSDHVVESLQWSVDRQRARLHRHLRRHVVLLRRGSLPARTASSPSLGGAPCRTFATSLRARAARRRRCASKRLAVPSGPRLRPQALETRRP